MNEENGGLSTFRPFMGSVANEFGCSRRDATIRFDAISKYAHRYWGF
jgi:hypothetical protein